MNIEHIRAFLEVAANGSFQVAAHRINVTQSTVSARIKVLEKRLNRDLFRRKRHGIELTSGGHQFHAHAIEIVRAWERGQQAASLPRNTETAVCLGVEDNHWPQLVPEWLDLMASAGPNIAATVLSEPSEILMNKLKGGFLDLAVLYDPQYCAEVAIEELCSEELVMVSSHERQVESGAVSGYVFIDWGEYFRNQHNLMFPNLLNHRLTTRNALLALAHIRAHGGSGYFVRSLVEPLLETGDLHIVQGAPHFLRHVYLGVNQNSYGQEAVGLAIESMKSLVSTAGNDDETIR